MHPNPKDHIKGDSHLAYIQNRRTGIVVKASQVANPSGFILKEVTAGESPSEFDAQVEHLGQPLALTYDRAATPTLTSPKITTTTTITRRQAPITDINPTQVALEKARQQAAEKAREKTKGQAQPPSPRKRTIFVPK